MSYRPHVASKIGRTQWIMQRVSAVLLLVLVFVHFILQHFSAEAVTTGLTVAQRFNSAYWQGFYAIFVVLGLYHGINGLIGIINDYMPKPLARGIIATVLWTGAAWLSVVAIAKIVNPQPLADVKMHYADNGFSAGATRGNPPAAPEKYYSFREETAELPMLRFYLEHHTHHNVPVELNVIFGPDVQIPADQAAELGAHFDRWAAEQIIAGQVSIDERDRGEIFSSTYEFAIWASNVRLANAKARGDTAVAERLADVHPFDATLY